MNETPLIQAASVFDIDRLPEGYVSTMYEASPVRFERIPSSRWAEHHLNTDWLNRFSYACADGTFLAGGFAADMVSGQQTTKDVDLYFANPGAFRETVEKLIAGGYFPAPQFLKHIMHRKLIEGEALDREPFITLEPPEGSKWLPVQAIKIHWFRDAEEVLDSFDFTCIQFAIDMKTQDLVFNPMGAIDLAAKRLVQHRVEGVHSTSLRLKRYLAKGFRPPEDRLRACNDKGFVEVAEVA